MNNKIRVRFCPSPTGMPHVGNLRTALFNYVFAKHHQGTFVFRIEDTDKERYSEESYQALLDSLSWLGLHWDEGPEVGGDYGPYRQSERGEIYQDILNKLQDTGLIYESYSTAQEVEERHLAAGRNPKLGYDNYDRELTSKQITEFKNAGRSPIWRMRMPEEEIVWQDLVRGEIRILAKNIPDFALTRANGDPLYTLVNPVDDALMQITHVLRGEDILSSTPRQIVLYQALQEIGVTNFIPEFGHLPFVMGQGNKKLSKRDPESSFMFHVDRGEIPEGLINYLALLGWSISPDEDIFSLTEMIKTFDISKVNANPARYDQKKADAINAEHIRLLTLEDFTNRLEKYLLTKQLLVAGEYSREHLKKLAELIQTRITILGEAWKLIEFAFVEDSLLEFEEKSVVKFFTPEAEPVLSAAITVLEKLDNWSNIDISRVLKEKLVEEMEGKPRKVFGIIRLAITGAAVSPPLFESMEILGRESCLNRLQRAKGMVFDLT